MPFIDYATCEPLRVWNRLEPRTRKVEFDAALTASVHDPMWMLARQWQLGEFKGEDTGSAVFATLARRVTPVSAVAVGSGPPEAEDLSLPVEARVERLPVPFPPLVRAQAGRRFLATMAETAAEQPPATPFVLADHRGWFAAAFPIPAPAVPDEEDLAGRARARADARSRRVAAALAGRAVDGVELFAALVPGMTLAQLPAPLVAKLPPDHGPLVLAALERFRAWFAALYPADAGADGWDPAQLEYRAACTVPRDVGTVTLTVDEHVTGRLDWHAFDQGLGGVPGAGSQTDVRSVLPAPAEFAGMPRPRWWELEDAAVDLGHFRAQATDLAKIVVAEFALLYGNNWFVVPYRQPVGTLAEVEGVVVTDSFGFRTFVTAAVPSSGGRWTAWDLFSLSPRGTVAAGAPLPQHLFIPATVGQVAEGEPHESVALVRDESANMVWAVERRIPDGMGGSRDGTAAARSFTDALAALADGDGAGSEAESGPDLRYRLGTSVPESWIPFVPVHETGSTREIRLQRASMPRFVGGETERVRPLTSILRPGLPADDALPETSAYLLNEEEVPRVGVNVHGGMRRARWLDGRTVVWHGRTVVSGRGEVDAGLRFDVVEPRDRPT